MGRALAGDAESFGLLFRRHGPDVHAFAQRRTRSADIADDIVSIAFEKCWHALDQLGAHHGDRFRPWAFRIAANEMASMMRSNARRRDREHLAALRGEIATEGGTGTDVTAMLDRLDRSDELVDVLDAMSDLSERHQEVLALRYLAELSPAETALALGVSRGYVAVLLHRAVRALRDGLERPR